MISSTGIIIVVLYMIFVVAGCIIAGIFIASTRRGRAEGGSTAHIAKAERLEPIWGVFVLVLLGVLLAFTIWQAPWFQDVDENGQAVKVEGVQFGFLVQPTTVKAGQPITFTVTSRDVNHAMGLYNKDDELIMNVEAIPGHDVQRTRTLEAGTYHIRCLEFCGYQHHKMVYPSFQVTQ